MMNLDEKKKLATAWFRSLRDEICAEFEAIEMEYAAALHSPPEGESARVYGAAVGGEADPSSISPHGCAIVAHPAPPQGGSKNSAKFSRKIWNHANGGGGEISIMKGRVFEKVGVNISVVHGEFSEQFRHEIPGAAENPTFWAAGISLVAHMQSPHVPAAHMNTRMIVVGEEVASRQSPVASEPLRSADGPREPEAEGRTRGSGSGGDTPPAATLPKRIWFGGGGDLNPMVPNDADTRDFHAAFENACNALDETVKANWASEPSASEAARSGGQQTNTEQLKFYPAFSKWCDEYFFLPHRNEMRGVGGIFYDYLGLNRFGTDTSPVTSGRFGKGGVTKEATAAGMALAANAPLSWEEGFHFTQHVGRTFKDIYSTLVRRHMNASWTQAERHHQLVRRGRYAEYNLLYDRGTRFGLMTGGNTEAILMSLPPMAIWE